jgi:CelD/BcsL family acetyltransferase involved in cellulose biosynthesis
MMAFFKTVNLVRPNDLVVRHLFQPFIDKCLRTYELPQQSAFNVMNVVALRPFAAESRSPPAIEARIARIEVFDDFAAAEPHWRALERARALATPYQNFDFLRLWHRHIGAGSGIEPFIVVAFNSAGTALFLWPFGCRRLAGLRVVEFLGGKHANFNTGIWHPDAAGQIGADDLRGVIAHLRVRADLLVLINQPLTWAGTTNPMALLPWQSSANFGFSGALAKDFDALLYARTNAATRKKMRKKERTLASLGAVEFKMAQGSKDIRQTLDVFFKQKSLRMRSLGIGDVFATPDVRRFIEAAATEPRDDGTPLIELYALKVNDIVVATMGGISGTGRFCAMFNSIAQGRFAIESPGEQLIVHLVRHCCERGFDTFDLGIGDARYKNLFCGDAEPLFNSYLPLSATGRQLAFVYRAVAAVKRTIKRQPALWALVGATRRLRAWLTGL